MYRCKNRQWMEQEGNSGSTHVLGAAADEDRNLFIQFVVIFSIKQGRDSLMFLKDLNKIRSGREAKFFADDSDGVVGLLQQLPCPRNFLGSAILGEVDAHFVGK